VATFPCLCSDALVAGRPGSGHPLHAHIMHVPVPQAYRMEREHGRIPGLVQRHRSARRDEDKRHGQGPADHLDLAENT
jgi:hypothetical protein